MSAVENFPVCILSPLFFFELSGNLRRLLSSDGSLGDLRAARLPVEALDRLSFDSVLATSSLELKIRVEFNLNSTRSLARCLLLL